CEIEFYGFARWCQAIVLKKPFLFKPLAHHTCMRLRRGGPFRPIIAWACGSAVERAAPCDTICMNLQC
ncbi:hypothetical protein N5J66_22865, partial [Pseudomonas juntendi]|uniref:hypothetical protein n=1 Tax=Pseudomonas juntendi TaxID=2666183 RepID=UPI00244D219C